MRIANGSKERLQLGNLNVHRDWGWAPEYVDAMWRILQHDQAEDFVIATGRMHSLSDFVDRAFAVLGLVAHEHVDADGSLLRPLDISRSVGNPEKAHRLLGWSTRVGFDELVQNLVKGESR